MAGAWRGKAGYEARPEGNGAVRFDARTKAQARKLHVAVCTAIARNPGTIYEAFLKDSYVHANGPLDGEAPGYVHDCTDGQVTLDPRMIAKDPEAWGVDVEPGPEPESTFDPGLRLRRGQPVHGLRGRRRGHHDQRESHGAADADVEGEHGRGPAPLRVPGGRPGLREQAAGVGGRVARTIAGRQGPGLRPRAFSLARGSGGADREGAIRAREGA